MKLTLTIHALFAAFGAMGETKPSTSLSPMSNYAAMLYHQPLEPKLNDTSKCYYQTPDNIWHKGYVILKDGYLHAGKVSAIKEYAPWMHGVFDNIFLDETRKWRENEDVLVVCIKDWK